MIRLLVERGPNINTRTTDGKTILGILEDALGFLNFKQRIEAELHLLAMDGIQVLEGDSSDEEVYWDAEESKKGSNSEPGA